MMAVVTSRSDFEKLVEARLEEAKTLLAQKHWDGAYYLAGYAIEFALKVRIIAALMSSNSFPARSDAENFYKHGLTQLRKLAGLEDEMNADAAVSPYWDIVKDWSEQARYVLGKSDKESTDLLNAIEKEVLPWIKARW